VAISDAVATADLSSSAFKNIIITTKEAADTTLTINKDQVINFTAADAGSAELITVKLNDVTGANDVVKIVLDAAAKDTNIALGTKATDKALVIDAGIETLNITSLVKAASPETTANTVNAKLIDVTSIIIDGDAKITLGHANTAATDYKNVSMIDASALKAGLTFDANEITIANGATIKGGSGADSITAGYNTQVITLGAGDDTVILGTGNANANKYSTITDFSKGDKIDISQLKASSKNAATSISKAEKLASTSTFREQIRDILKADGTETAVAKYFQLEGDTYIVVDTADSLTESITRATDGIIKLAGFTGDLTIDSNSIITVA
ncbi:calcium-binding protein, partial [Campylobacter fetus]|uniref:hypothetical protein n=1 Tax=Campylobacter fetus TaxID=196 RepID=UPI003AF6C83A